jgi:hypothetical protein
MAAKMLDQLEKRKKQVTPGNVAYYVLLHLKSGRRSYTSGRSDAMAPGTQLDGSSAVMSFEEPAGTDPDTGEEIALGEMLAGHHEDPALAGARNVDWERFLNTHDSRYGKMLLDLTEGRKINETGTSYDVSRKLKKRLAEDLVAFMGPSAIEDAMHQPSWRGNIHADREKFACRADRRHR